LIVWVLKANPSNIRQIGERVKPFRPKIAN